MKPIQRMTLRLPEDLARRLAASIPAGQRNQFVPNLVRRELDRESWELEVAAIRLALLEITPAQEDVEWFGLGRRTALGRV